MLNAIDLTQSLDRQEYQMRLPVLQSQLELLCQQVKLQKRPVVIVFESWETAGKGMCIKRLTERLDPAVYRVHSFPASLETADWPSYKYLSYFWEYVPHCGQIVIFDRSWYWYVANSHISESHSADRIQRDYRELNFFERQLLDFGTSLIKFFIHIDQNEQSRRLEIRQKTANRPVQITQYEQKHVNFWQAYHDAVSQMLLRTSTLAAPWITVEGNDKRWSQIKVLATVTDLLASELNYHPSLPTDLPLEHAEKQRRKKKHESRKG